MSVTWKTKVHTGAHLALVEAKPDKDGYRKHTRTPCQASRCPHCHALVAAGPSWDHHVFFCTGERL